MIGIGEEAGIEDKDPADIFDEDARHRADVTKNSRS